MFISCKVLCRRIAVAALAATAGCSAAPSQKQRIVSDPAPHAAVQKQAVWQSLFDGKTLGHWKPTNFGGQGEVTVEDGAMFLTHGETLTGVTWQGALPAKMNYEIRLDARRVDGTDFFCGLTFPYNDDSASLIVGGWGGGVCGISCIDDNDAARNDTTTVQEFKTGKWYAIRLRVTPGKIQAWIDGKSIVDADVKGKKITVRDEVEASQPLGLASYQTTGEIKNIQLMKLDASAK